MNTITHWQPGAAYAKGDIIHHGGRLYRIKRCINNAERPPGTFKSLSHYRPLTPLRTGTKTYPIPYVQGIDCYSGLIYCYEGLRYLRRSDAPGCYNEPNAERVSWELIE